MIGRHAPHGHEVTSPKGTGHDHGHSHSHTTGATAASNSNHDGHDHDHGHDGGGAGGSASSSSSSSSASGADPLHHPDGQQRSPVHVPTIPRGPSPYISEGQVKERSLAEKGEIRLLCVKSLLLALYLFGQHRTAALC